VCYANIYTLQNLNVTRLRQGYGGRSPFAKGMAGKTLEMMEIQ
jgi:hypothetical protein